MPTDPRILRQSLERLQRLVPCQYAQWLIEDPLTRDYRVVAWKALGDRPGYEIAYRTGVIGQVFRTAKAIMVPDTQQHPLYEPFDEEVAWELAVPASREGRLAGVLNLEGSGTLDLSADRWQAIREVVAAEAGWQLPSALPSPGQSLLLETRFIGVFAENKQARAAAAELGEAIARGGAAVLLVGDYPELVRTPYPTLSEVEAEQLPVGAGVHPVGRRLDLLGAGTAPPAIIAAASSRWRNSVQGRYDFVLYDRRGSADSPSADSSSSSRGRSEKHRQDLSLEVDCG